jgi:hypothetical protein
VTQTAPLPAQTTRGRGPLTTMNALAIPTAFNRARLAALRQDYDNRVRGNFAG